MSYLVATYLGLLASSVSGAFLFFGFALFGPPKRRPAKSGTLALARKTLPFRWVSLHVVLATITLGLFTATIFAGHLP